MKTKTFTTPLAALLISFFCVNAQAGFVDFISLADGTHGESAWTTLSIPSLHGLKVTGHHGANSAFSYLDAGTAGLGVCKSASGADVKNPGSGSNLCSDSGDDNVTVGEYLEFTFDEDVTVENIWFNNNHDDPKDFLAGDKVNIGGSAYSVATGYVGGPNGIGTFSLLAGETLKVGYNNQQFYVSGMEVSVSAVPVPAAVWLFGTAIAGLFGFNRRRKTA